MAVTVYLKISFPLEFEMVAENCIDEFEKIKPIPISTGIKLFKTYSFQLFNFYAKLIWKVLVHLVILLKSNKRVKIIN